MTVLAADKLTNGIPKDVQLESVDINDEQFFKISNCDQMRPFFMSIVSGANHWMFISSNGGLSAGRRNSEIALFPYYTDDKITELAEITGAKTIMHVSNNGKTVLWEPLSNTQMGAFNISRHVYKNWYGNKVIFEEVNHDLNLTFRYRWSSSNKYGFVRTSTLINNSASKVDINILDGIQNIIPAKVGAALQNSSSNLVDAYKRNELVADVGMGIYALSATIVDRAEPAESLKANIAWSFGLENPKYLVSSQQLNTFRQTALVNQESDVKAEKGAYFLNHKLQLNANDSKQWHLVSDVNKNHASVIELIDLLKKDHDLFTLISEDIELGTQKLIELVAASDGLQHTNDQRRDARHFSNTMFNIMRGGIFPHNYNIDYNDFKLYLEKANPKVALAHASDLQTLGSSFTLSELKVLVEKSSDPDFIRLCSEYMPLTFSRRHGDPSRPWNRFDINCQDELDGSIIYDYQGNWRDIFQNWEALSYAYPEFVNAMIHKFLNATTFEGYNPYRVMKDGFDWEVIEHDNPWAYIGYWGDHQIIYLLKLLEVSNKFDSQTLKEYFNKDIFVYANVPYVIKSYDDIYKNSKDTIEFDFDLDKEIRSRMETEGADGALLKDKDGHMHRVNFVEKILATLLSKLSNLVPEAGIWLNTQRPEWNDANNALVGNGVSMVTVYYIRRFLNFFEDLFKDASSSQVAISKELYDLFQSLNSAYLDYSGLIEGNISDGDRKSFTDSVGQAASQYRLNIYRQSFSGDKEYLEMQTILSFLKHAQASIEHTIKANKRSDNLYHAYNLISPSDSGIAVQYLDEMLEGQVAVLSSGMLSTVETLELLDAMKASALFRDDQYSYILYPNKNLPGFLEKNNIPPSAVTSSALLSKLIAEGNLDIVEKNVSGGYHFNGDFKNANDLEAALEDLPSQYAELVQADKNQIFQTFENMFEHKKFTGRSGTFFGYEGLGSIYWHMVSKLLLAVQECCLKAISEAASPESIGRLLEHYYEINAGIGVHKPPTLYGAFPTDPYSHTPGGRGAQQPGMTGQVKEDVLSRFGELGLQISNGEIHFKPDLLRQSEFSTKSHTVKYYDVKGALQELKINAGSLFFTICQVPVVFEKGSTRSIKLSKSGDTPKLIDGNKIDKAASQEIFARTGKYNLINVVVLEKDLK